MKRKLALVVGTRPEIMKMAPIIRLAQRMRLPYVLVHTNQHYSEELDSIFFQELELPKPQYNLLIGSGTHAEITGKMMVGFEKVFQKVLPAVVCVQGDTNTVLAGALAAAKLNIDVAHIEAGLRSYDRKMPEEQNRVLVDHLSTYAFCPTANAVKLLLKEGIHRDRIFMTGNTIVDAVSQHVQIAREKSNILSKLDLRARSYILLTAHREENVDDPRRLKGILKGVYMIYREFKKPIIYPMHPRTKKRLQQYEIRVPDGIHIVPPAGYFDFLVLENNAYAILTDSGGVQEEACILKVPCLTLRDSTERPETLTTGGNIIGGYTPETIIRSMRRLMRRKKVWFNPLGDGNSAKRILRHLATAL